MQVAWRWGRWREVRPRVRTWLGVTLVVLAVADVTVSGLEQIHQRQVTACQVRFNNAYATVAKLRSHLADTDRRVTVAFQTETGDLIHGVFHPPPGSTQAERNKLAFAAEAKWETVRHAYRVTERRISAERKANPFPALPSAACR